jgi:hypothetical protein
MADTIELVRFRLQPGNTAADWLKVNEKINDWMKVQPGFQFRSFPRPKMVNGGIWCTGPAWNLPWQRGRNSCGNWAK